MNRDYYSILEIPIDADPADLKKAYRRLSLLYHPDRGGSHEKMLLINEAFQVLSNPESRRLYDSTRAGDERAQAEAEDRFKKARENAENYPRSWEEFDSVFDRICADFAKAEYSTWASGVGYMPSAGKSVSGWVFILIGAIIGAVIADKYLGLDGGPCAIIAGLGAWAGRGIHQLMAGIVQAPSGAAVPSQEPQVIACQNCGQSLRVPGSAHTIRCPRCGTESSVS